jgi:rhodanese-related sulfurtransferase/rubrerythrin
MRITKSGVIMQALDFTNIDSGELKHFIDNNNEKKYTIIDVRQPQEYQDSHIPGATLIPLPELIEGKAPLPDSEELVFMCRSGSRSKAAAVFADSFVNENQKIYNLSDGILGWYGKTLGGGPKVQLLGDLSDIEDVVLSAMDLEKGAFNFYKSILERFPDEPFYNAMEYLSLAETDHAKALYGIIEKRNDLDSDGLLPAFEDLFSSMKGEIMEGGMSLDSAIQHLELVKEDRAVHILDLCLDIEFSAFDLYKNAANITENSEIKKILESIANGEKNHMKKLADSFTMIG